MKTCYVPDDFVLAYKQSHEWWITSEVFHALETIILGVIGASGSQIWAEIVNLRGKTSVVPSCQWTVDEHRVVDGEGRTTVMVGRVRRSRASMFTSAQHRNAVCLGQGAIPLAVPKPLPNSSLGPSRLSLSALHKSIGSKCPVRFYSDVQRTPLYIKHTATEIWLKDIIRLSCSHIAQGSTSPHHLCTHAQAHEKFMVPLSSLSVTRIVFPLAHSACLLRPLSSFLSRVPRCSLKFAKSSSCEKENDSGQYLWRDIGQIAGGVESGKNKGTQMLATKVLFGESLPLLLPAGCASWIDAQWAPNGRPMGAQWALPRPLLATPHQTSLATAFSSRCRLRYSNENNSRALYFSPPIALLR